MWLESHKSYWNVWYGKLAKEKPMKESVVLWANAMSEPWAKAGPEVLEAEGSQSSTWLCLPDVSTNFMQASGGSDSHDILEVTPEISALWQTIKPYIM